MDPQAQTLALHIEEISSATPKFAIFTITASLLPRLQRLQQMFHTSNSTVTHQKLLNGHTLSSSHDRSQPSMDSSHFYEDSSEDELPDNSDISFNPWAKLKRSSLREAGNRISLTSFRFSDQSPSWRSSASAGEVLPPLEIKPVRHAPVKNSEKPGRASAPTPQRNEQFQENSSRAPGEDLQNYMQTLLGGSITEGVHQEIDLYQECLGRRSVHQPRFLSPPASRERAPYNKSRKRMSIMSTASDVSAVPSLVFSDVDVQAPRPSTLSISTDPRATAHRNSIISLNSIDSIGSNKSWFIDDESPPQSPVEPTPLKKRVNFIREVEMGMSCFDDGDDGDCDDEGEEEEEEKEEEEKEKEKEKEKEILSPRSPLFVLVSAEASLESPTTRKKQNLGLSIETKVPRSPPNMLSPSLPPLTHSPISPRSSICASPNKRRSRRRTASSECIVLEALEKMNAVMYEFANEDINRKSVVGIDLPGNQVSVDAYGELWW